MTSPADIVEVADVVNKGPIAEVAALIDYGLQGVLGRAALLHPQS